MIEPNQSIGYALRSCFFFYFFFGSCAALLKELAPLNMFLVGSREKGCAVVRSRQANTRNASRRTHNVGVRVSSTTTTTTHMLLLVSPRGRRECGQRAQRSCVQVLRHDLHVRDVPRAQVSVEGAGTGEHVAAVAERRGARRATVRSRHREMTQETHPDITHRHVWTFV